MKLRKGNIAKKRVLLFFFLGLFTLSNGYSQEKGDSLLKVLEEHPPEADTSKVDLLNQLGRRLYSRFPDSAEVFLRKARKLADKEGYEKGTEESLNLLGIVYYVRSDYQAALKYWKRLLEKWRAKEQPLDIANIQNNLGLLYKKLGSYKKALQAHEEALSIRDSLGQDDKMAQSWNNLGMVHYELGNLEKAQSFYQKALKRYQEQGLKEKLGGAYNNLSLVYRQEGAYDQAIEFAKKAIRHDRESGGKRNLANDLVNLGLVHKEKGELDSAMKYYRLAEKAYRSIGNKGGLVTAIMNIAGVELKRNEPSKARRLALKAFRMADSISSLNKMKGASAYLAEAHASLGNPWEAYRFQKIHDSISDSLLSVEKRKEIAQLEAKYEFQKNKKELEREKAKRRKMALRKQEAEMERQRIWFTAWGGAVFLVLIIAFLFIGYRQKRSANRSLQDQKAELKKEKDEKELLLKELNHRVKNNLQLINSLLSLQGKRIEDEELRALHIDSQNRIRSMGLLHERIYQSGEMDGAGLEQFIQELAERLKEAYGMEDKVDLKINVRDLELGIPHFTPIALILNELISNALKYAYRGLDHGELRISLYPEKDRYVLEVSDNGVGFDPEKEKEGGLGLEIVSSLSDQIGGQVDIRNREKGTQFRITFPQEADSTSA